MGPARNSSSVGRNVGASCKPCGREDFASRRCEGLDSLRRSTDLRSRPADLRALRGMLLALEPDGPLAELLFDGLCITTPIRPPRLDGTEEVVPLDMLTLILRLLAVVVAMETGEARRSESRQEGGS
jgi:hypothetical protein